jgi:hypothetical protein
MSCRPLGINASSNSLHTPRPLTTLSNISTSLQKPNTKKTTSISQTWKDSILMAEATREVVVTRDLEVIREVEVIREAEVIREVETIQEVGVV